MPEREFVQWVITKDHVGAGNDDGRIGPRDANLTRDEIIAHPTATKFRLYSDDNELYYEGMMTVPDADDDEDLFSPLDDFGEPNAGCTYMTIRNKTTREWEDL